MRLEVYVDSENGWVESIFEVDEWDYVISVENEPYRMIDDSGFVVREFYPRGWSCGDRVD